MAEASPLPDWLARRAEELKRRCEANLAVRVTAVASIPPPAAAPRPREDQVIGRRPVRAQPGSVPTVPCDECHGPGACFWEMPEPDRSPAGRLDPLVVRIPPIPVMKRCPKCEFKRWATQEVFPPVR